MVDAAASFEGNEPARAAVSQRSSRQVAPVASVSAVTGETLAAYEEFCRSALFAPAQSPEWVRNWSAELAPDAILATLALDGAPVLSLALERVRMGPFRVARFMGGRHANGNFAAADPAWLGKAGRADIELLFKTLARARPDIDLVVLDRMPSELDGIANPLVLLPHFASPNLSLAVGLDGGFDVLLEGGSGKRKRKKYRSQMRKFDEAGGHRRVEAASPREVHRLLDAFFTMKEARFRKMGVADVFADQHVRSFFKGVFTDALSKERPPFLLHGLEVAGKLYAVTGSSICGRRIICEFGAISEDGLGHASPGDFLFFENIQEACEKGFLVYDFSVGDEPYKRQWCDIETRHADVVVPLTLKGRALALALRQEASLKAFIKNSPTIWRLAKMLRRKTAARTAAPADDN